MKINPFRPGNIVTPGMFAGRGDELVALERVLFQTRAKKSQHFLITGERGIGKSSLLYYLQLIAKGKIKTTEDVQFRLLTVPIELDQGDDFTSIVQRVGHELRTGVGEIEPLMGLAKDTWDFLKRWEVLGVKFRESASATERHQLIDELCESIRSAVGLLHDQIDGCIILIDEADRVAASAGLGTFTKLLTERLTKRECHNVTLGLAGVSGILSKLRQSHESAPRVFHHLRLEPLSNEDRLSVVRKGLEEAKETNGRHFTITTDAANAISSLSEGYPNFIQQFAFCAFGSDLDDQIDYDDVMNGAFEKNGAFQQLGEKYFSELYFEQIGSDEYRGVLRAMANHPSEWMAKNQLKTATKLKPGTLNNAITALKKRGIIIPQQGKHGIYRLPNKSFAVWIKAFTEAIPAKSPDRSIDEKRGDDSESLPGSSSESQAEVRSTV